MSVGAARGDSFLVTQAEIRNQRGLHARAAAKFVQALNGFQAEVIVVRGDMEVSGRSIMGLMMLAAGPGAVIEIRASGPDAAGALEALGDLIGRNFDED